MSTANDTTIVNCPSCGTGNRVRADASGVPHCGNCGRPLPWLVDADQATFQATVEQGPVAVLIDFWAPWCGPCRMVEGMVRMLSREMAGKLKAVRINSDAAPELAQRFDIRGIPTLILFEGGQVRDRLTGAVDAATLRRWLEARLAARRPG